MCCDLATSVNWAMEKNVHVPEEAGVRDSLLQNMRARHKQKWCNKVRRVNSKGAVLVNVWSFMVYTSAMNPLFSSTASISKQVDTPIGSYAFVVALCASVVVGPLGGLLASIRFNRYRTVSVGLWLLWTGNAISLPMFIVESLFPLTQKYLPISGLVVAVGLSCTGLLLYQVNALPFGLDQMPYAGGEQLSAFIHWHSWSVFAGVISGILGAVALECIPIDGLGISLLQSFGSLVALSVALGTKFVLRSWLTIEPKSSSPLKTIYGVLKFAAKHRVPVRRSAFTYWETWKPPRIDLAKTKYGGPFTNEQVEDVKAWLRMMVVITTIGAVGITASALMFSLNKALGAQYRGYGPKYEKIVTNTSGIIALLITPVYEIIIYPLFKIWIPNTLKKVGIAQLFALCASLLLLVSSLVWYAKIQPTTCCLVVSNTSTQFSSVGRHWIEIPATVLLCSYILVLYTVILEFVCAQSPYVLRGLLVGVVNAVLVISIAIGAGVYVAWSMTYEHKGPNSPTCVVWFYLFTTIAAVLGSIVWCYVAKWYRRRERDEPDLCRMFAENYYDH